VVVVAGMEGALTSVIGGLTGAPIVAVPTSVGYGASLEGVTALLGMLASCAAGVTVVGIDNGFGAAAAVLRLLPTRAPAPVRADGAAKADAVAPGGPR
jgi:NCAIR mutase (PurE)-related protein